MEQILNEYGEAIGAAVSGIGFLIFYSNLAAQGALLHAVQVFFTGVCG